MCITVVNRSEVMVKKKKKRLEVAEKMLLACEYIYISVVDHVCQTGLAASWQNNQNDDSGH